MVTSSALGSLKALPSRGLPNQGHVFVSCSFYLIYNIQTHICIHMHTDVHTLARTHISPYTWCANSSFPIEAQRVLLILESLSSKKRYKCVP